MIVVKDCPGLYCGGTIDNPLVKLITTIDKPVIAAVNGIAAGAGANLALACDLVLAARSSSFLQAFARIGLIPDAGGTWVLPRLVGAARARGLAMLAEPLPAEKAEAWGLIWKCVDDDKLAAEVAAVAGKLAAAPTYALALAKRALAQSTSNTLAQQLDLQRHLPQHCHITYLAPGRLGMRLIAEARVRHRGDRNGVYDVTVKSDAGETIAEFRGHSRAIPGTFLPGT